MKRFFHVHGRSARVLLAVAAWLIPHLGLADISLENGDSLDVFRENGDCFVDMPDIVFGKTSAQASGGSLAPGVERVYNSKTGFSGIFGEGWGCDFEVYLDIEPDGSVIVHEYGGGADNEFRPQSTTTSETRAVDSILAAALANRDVITDKELDDLRHRLINDSEFRKNQVRHYQAKGLLRMLPPPPGTRLVSLRFGMEAVIKMPYGYRREDNSGQDEMFDNNGRLIGRSDPGGTVIQMSRDALDRLSSMEDNEHRSISFAYNAMNLVSRVTASNGTSFTYEYNQQRELILVHASTGDEDRFTYDALGRHNLTSWRHDGKLEAQIDYYPISQFENVKSVTRGDGSATAYSYWIDDADSGHYIIAQKESDSTGRVTSTQSFEYFSKHDQYGRFWTWRIINTRDGSVTDTTYDEEGNPLSTTHGAKK
jgi:YD repeat-containing protein